MIKLSDFVFDYLYKYGLRDVFMLPGGGCMHLCDSLGKSKLNFICCLHEQVAAIAALAYAQYKNDIGVALVTTGPGSTNAITGVAGAWAESVPLLVISGQVKTSDISGKKKIRMLGFQEFPTVELVKPITKYAVTVKDPDEIKYHLQKAIYIAKQGRCGPVWLDIPLDIQASFINEKELKNFFPPEEKKHSLKKVKEKFLKLLYESKRPVILAGYGIRLSNAVGEFEKIVYKLKIPVLTTWKGADLIPFDNPYYFGRPGTAVQRTANFILQNCDLLISIGARLDYGQIGFEHSTFAREAKKIIVDIDKNEFKKFKFKVDLKLVMDCKKLISALLNENINYKTDKEWINYCNKLNKKYSIVLSELSDKKNYISTYILAQELSKQLNKNAIFVPGSSGMSSDIPYQVFKVKKGQRIINSPGLGAMGFGIPSALGVCIASGKKQVICTNGDGGFQLNIQDLETIRRLNLPVKFFVINNKGYGSIKATQRNYFKGFYVGSDLKSGLSLPNLKKIAYAYNFKFFKLKDPDKIRQTVKDVLKEKKPVICEVIVDPEEITLFKISSFITKNGKMKSKPLEDLYPFLPRDEFNSNMIVKPVE